MKKLATFVFALLLAGSLSFAQATGTTAAPATDQKTDNTKAPEEAKKASKGKKSHKGSKKSKKGASADATASPK